MARATIALFLALVAGGAPAADLPFVNWENHPVHALDLSPDRTLLAVAHTADARVQLFDVTTGEAIPVGHVAVGVDPVSVRFRSSTELWVVNHISDSVSVVDVPARRVRATLPTADEPYDVAFAGGRAFVSCSQANRVLVFDPNDLARVPSVVPIDAEDPRALAVSPDGRTVYAAIFESGNASTILAGGLQMDQNVLPNAVSDPRGPYGGVNPPPNAGNAFDPPLNPAATPPRVGLIVRRNNDGRWRDVNNRDWTELVSGSLASASGRPVGWDLPDRDLAIIDAASLSVRYASGLMNIVMGLAVNPASGEVGAVGTEAFNEERFEPNVNSRFVRAHLARVNPAPVPTRVVSDLNPHLTYQVRTLPQDQRDRAIGDPRAIAWSADGQRAWVAGMGSNNVIRIDAQGARVGTPIAVGEGPVALALDEPRSRLYVWNHFDASLSAIDTATSTERTRVAAFNPLPAAIRAGRPLLYDTHRTSGLGQVACASCHVDARMDRLAWDLGDPSAAPQRFDQNCITTLGVDPCRDFHAMKGPMTTQTMQDIIGNEPFHWRGDRAGLEAFNPAFQGLLGDDRQLTPAEMQAFEDFLATVTFPPNPFRNFDNTLPGALPLVDHYTSGRFAMAGLPLGTGNAVRGLELYTRGLLDPPLHCASCHTLPTGMAVNGPLFLGTVALSIGGTVVPTGPLGENHLGIVSVDGTTNVSIKVPHLRNVYEKVGFETTQRENRAGFGFLHDGSVDSLSRFISARLFDVQSDQDVADIIALMLAFAGSGFDPAANPVLGANPPQSRDSHAAVGAQLTLAGPVAPPRADELMALARSGAVGLVVRRANAGYAYDAASDRFLTADGSPPLTLAGLRGLASADDPQTWTAVPAGLAVRLGTDRDGDGVGDAREIAQGSNPADAASSTLRAVAGLWFNPARSGHGFDLQYLGSNMFVTWYTYQDDGTPTWYLAAAPTGNPWTGVLNRYTWNPATGYVDFQAAGELRLTFSGTGGATFDWRLGARSGSEPMQPLVPAATMALPDHTGTWYDPRESGWGLSIYNAGDVRVSVLYFYDGSNQPRWVLGQGDNRASETLPMLSFSGFCPGCTYVPVTAVSGGQVQLAFDRARAGTLTTDAFFAGQPAAHWRRGPVAIAPLSDATTRPAQR
jgi:YVTN family beta-propeller protein